MSLQATIPRSFEPDVPLLDLRAPSSWERDLSLRVESSTFAGPGGRLGDDYPAAVWRVVKLVVGLLERPGEPLGVERVGSFVVVGKRQELVEADSSGSGDAANAVLRGSHRGERKVVEIESLRACAAAPTSATSSTVPRRILLDGASPPVAAATLHWAGRMGAEVTTVCDASATSSMSSLGVDRVLTRRGDDAPEQGYDLIVDVAGRTSFRDVAPSLSEGGVFAIVGRSATQLLELVFLWCLALGYGASASKLGLHALPPRLAR